VSVHPLTLSTTSAGASRLAPQGQVRIGEQSQAARYYVAADIGQLEVVAISISSQPHERVGDAHAELLGEHAGGLIGYLLGQINPAYSRAKLLGLLWADGDGEGGLRPLAERVSLMRAVIDSRPTQGALRRTG
jgi:hypothetical protein